MQPSTSELELRVRPPWLRRWFSFPLLAKELTELAARRRTYWARIVYVVLLYGLGGCLLYLGSRGRGAQGAIGQGGELLGMICALQVAGVLLFLPSMMAGVVAAEKERATLTLLLVTDVRPWELLLQKYLSRLIPMLNFLLLSLPLMAIAYAFGGLTAPMVFASAWTLLLTALQVGAVGLLCSTYCRTTIHAFLATYLNLVLLYLGPLLVLLLLQATFSWLRGLDEEKALVFFPPYLLFSGSRNSILDTLTASLPILGSITMALGLARVFLARRAAGASRHVLRRVFGRLDDVFGRLNWLAGNVLLWRDRRTLPVDQPVAWRELHAKAFGKPHHLMRIGLALELPALWLALSVLFLDTPAGQCEELSAALFIIWIVAVLTLVAQSANAIASERSHQTLEVLLTTLLTGREVVQQKMAAIYRMMVVFAVPLVTLVLVEVWWEWRSPYSVQDNDPAAYLVISGLALVVDLPLLAWLSMWVGLDRKLRRQAMLWALGLVFIWCVGPVAGVFLLAELFRSMTPHAWWAMLISPVTLPVLNETGDLRELGPGLAWSAIFCNFGVHALALYVIRRGCLRRADRYLRGELPARCSSVPG